MLSGGVGLEGDGGSSAGSQENSFLLPGANHSGGMEVSGCPPFSALVEKKVKGE